MKIEIVKNSGLVHAAARVTGRSVEEIHGLLKTIAHKERLTKRKRGKSSLNRGVYPATARKLMEKLGLVWTPCMRIGSGCQVHMRAEELPPGKLVVRMSGHYAAVIDSVLIDNHDSTRGGTRCVYGYWKIDTRTFRRISLK